MTSGRSHWSNSARSAVFVKINAIAAVPLLLLLLFPSMKLLYFSIVFIGLLIYVEVIKGMSIKAFLRELNVKLTGHIKTTSNLLAQFIK